MLNSEVFPPPAGKPAPMSLPILHQDDDFVAIDKPAGLLVHRSALAAGADRFALQELRDQLGRVVFPCHRLDRPTSGVLLFALHREALRHAQAMLADGRAQKTYWAAVRGWPAADGTIDYPLRSEDRPDKVQAAVTAYRRLRTSTVPEPVGRYEEARFALLELQPKTGRKHQLRRHLAHLRHPILGDSRHGDGVQNRFLQQHCGIRRLMLRATRLRLPKPDETAPPLDITAPPEPVFEQILEQLGLAENAGTGL